MIQPKWRFFIVLVVILIWILTNAVYYQTTGMSGLGLRYVFLPIVLVVALIMVGARYVSVSYNFSSWRAALYYYLVCLFGLQHPLLVVRNGEAQVSQGEENIVLKMGGPGAINVQPGSVVLVEDYSGTVRTLGYGMHFLSRLETVKEVNNLEERHAEIDSLSATAKDGLEATAQDIRFRYQVCNDMFQTSRKPPNNLLSFSDEAVIQMTYNRPITQAGISDWHSVVNQVVESIITEFIRAHPIDYLTAPKLRGFEARDQLYKEFYSPSGVQRFREKGAELIWIDIGHFETQDNAAREQRVSTWQARWLGDANVVKAFGEAQRAAYMDQGRAEGQALILMSILNGLDQDATKGNPKINMRALYLARITELLDAMSPNPLLSEGMPPKSA